jgi:hypothetical protein
LKRSLLLAFALIAIAVAVPARGDVLVESKNFRQIGNVTIGGVAVGAQAVGDTYFIASWQSGLYSYDISNPKEPKELDHLLEIQANENEDLATNGKILLLSQFNRVNALNQLRVIDVSDPSDMKIIATVPGAGGHTLECLYDCKWAYASNSGLPGKAVIIDLRNPSKPKVLANEWSKPMGGVASHDVTEVRPGLVVTSSTPMFVLDTTDPAKPRALMKMPDETPHTGHNNIWPNGGTDRFLISASEGVNNGRCELYGADGKTLQIWDTTNWRRGGFKPVGTYEVTHGEGDPPVDALGVQGCSAHWAHEHPSFDNGGLVAMAAYSHGVRLLDIGSDGKPREVGWFLKDVHGAIDLEWINERIMYVVEDGGGIGGFDIVEYTGKL